MLTRAWLTRGDGMGGSNFTIAVYQVSLGLNRSFASCERGQHCWQVGSQLAGTLIALARSQFFVLPVLTCCDV